MLTARGVTKTFAARPEPVAALRGVDLDVCDRTFTAILGPSGCGKTTLLRVLAGFERPDAGDVRFGDVALDSPAGHVPPQRRGIGIVPQEGALFPHLSVAGNVAFGLVGRDRPGGSPAERHPRALRRHGGTRRGGPAPPRTRAARRARVEELLELVGLGGYGARRCHELSGGQQQRVALARALAPAPRVVLLDEPFSALDAGLRAELRVEVRELLRKAGTTAVLVTHDQEEALSLADHVAVMRAGRIVRAGSPRGVYLTPGDVETASFLGDVVLLPARLRPATAAIGGTGSASSAGAAGVAWQAECELGCVAVTCGADLACAPHSCTLMMRPEQLQLSAADRPGGPGGPGAPAVVVGVTYYGHDGLVRLRLGESGDGAAVVVRTHGHAMPAVGARVRVGVAGGVTVPVTDLSPVG